MATPGTTLSRRDLLGLRLPPVHAEGHWIRVHRRAMACRFEVTLSDEDQPDIAAAREALDEAERVEALLTVFRATSVIARVNREAARGPVGLDAELTALLGTCRELHARTGGAFDITSTPLSRAWGFLERDPRVPEPAQLEAARAAVGMDGVLLDAAAQTVRFRRPGLELNMGAVGKGYALARMAAILRWRGVRHALVSAGGSSIAALGGRGAGWPIDLHSRLRGEARIARLYLRDGAMATSGSGEQSFEHDGVRYGHVLDPRSGRPAASGLLSVSCIASDPAEAEALSTAFYVGGPALARDYCERHLGTLALLTPEGGARPLVYGAHDAARLELA